MKRLLPALANVVSLFSLIALIGCSTAPQESSDSNGAPAPEASSTHDDMHHDHGEHSGGAMDKMRAELAKLPPEDAASAEQQHFCPVSGEMLGTMGAPLKVDVNGQEVWICCETCKEQLLKSPEKYLAKLKRE